MTEKDKALIEEAKQIEKRDGWAYWEIWPLEEQAESKEAKRFLHNMATTLYHREEAAEGMI